MTGRRPTPLTFTVTRDAVTGDVLLTASRDDGLDSLVFGPVPLEAFPALTEAWYVTAVEWSAHLDDIADESSPC